MNQYKRLINSLILCQLLADELELMNLKGQDKQRANNTIQWLTTITAKYFLKVPEQDKKEIEKEFDNCMQVIRGILNEVEVK